MGVGRVSGGGDQNKIVHIYIYIYIYIQRQTERETETEFVVFVTATGPSQLDTPIQYLLIDKVTLVAESPPW
jgi:hypothetical protein